MEGDQGTKESVREESGGRCSRDGGKMELGWRNNGGGQRRMERMMGKVKGDEGDGSFRGGRVGGRM